MKLGNRIREIDKKFLTSRLARIAAGLRGFPSSLSIDISSTCNLKCGICSLKKWYPVTSGANMPQDIIDTIAHIVPRLRSISLQCNCEPLVNRHIVDIIRCFKLRNPSLYVSLITNGTLLTSSLASGLIDAGTDRICFSIDGASPETNDRIRSGAKLHEVIGNIRELTRQKQARQGRLPEIGITTVATRQNAGELLSILRLARELGAASFSINGLEPYDEEMERCVLWGETIDPGYELIFRELKREARGCGIDVRVPSLRIRPYTSCILTRCVIDAEGDVYPCSSLSYERPYHYCGERRIHPRISFGNLREKELGAIWNSSEYRYFRKKLLRGHFPEHCRKCLMRNQVLCP